MNLWLVFLTGLSIGSVSCLAIQGTLLASAIASRNKESGVAIHPILPTLAFLITKLISYTVLGFILGLLGQTLGITNQVFIIAQFIAGLYLITLGLNLLNVHPLFRYAVINPPRSLTRYIRQNSKSAQLFAPALLGSMTIFIPCGTTLAMETVAVASANPIKAALIMFVFTLGTSPIFLGLGSVTDFLTKKFQKNLMKIAGLLVLYFGITSINGALVLSGSDYTLQSLYNLIPIEINLGEVSGVSDEGRYVDGKKVYDIQVTSNGYYPNRLSSSLGTPTVLALHPSGKLGCASVFTIPELKISKSLTSGKDEIVEFIPTRKGTIIWSCSMGMYTGKVLVG